MKTMLEYFLLEGICEEHETHHFFSEKTIKEHGEKYLSFSCKIEITKNLADVKINKQDGNALNKMHLLHHIIHGMENHWEFTIEKKDNIKRIWCNCGKIY